MTWQVSEGSRLSWKLWDDEYVVFDHGSGNTHLLDLFSGQVLKALEEGPADAGLVAHRVAASVDEAAGPVLASRIEETLRRLEQAGLVEPVLA